MNDQTKDGIGLLPCPFCGKAPRAQWHGCDTPGMEDCGYYGIDCCNAFAHADDEIEAAQQWNRRALPPSATAQEAVATFVQSPYGNYPELKWRAGFVAKIGDRIYTAPPPQPVSETACVKCGQTDHGQQGEYHCPVCDLPTVWDESHQPVSETAAQASVEFGRAEAYTFAEDVTALVNKHEFSTAVDKVMRLYALAAGRKS